MPRNLLSVIVPVYGCAACLHDLVERTKKTVDVLNLELELILVCDRSPDNSWEYIKEICENQSFVKGILFSKNFGQHYAITAGLNLATGDFAVVMDCDLQDPPEEIEKLYLKAQDGFEIVYGYSSYRGKKGPFYTLLRKGYFKLYDTIVGTGYTTVNMSFFLMGRKAVNAFNLYKDKSRHIASIVRDLGFSFGGVEVQHIDRAEGSSTYNFSKRLKLALDGLIIYSSFFLRASLLVGFVFSGLAIVIAFFIAYNRLFQTDFYPGWTSIIVIVLLSTGVILSFLGVIGIYIEKMFLELKERPIYIIDEKLNFNNAD